MPWANRSSPADRRPEAEPYRTLTAPVVSPAAESPTAPMVRSARPLPSKSPEASALPNRSPEDGDPRTPPAPWAHSWLPASVRPAPEP